jgi:hypothetical protein
MTTPAQRLYTLPEPVQVRLCALVDAIAGMDAEEKIQALERLRGVAYVWAKLASDDCMPAAEVLALAQSLVGSLAVEAAPAHLKEGAA